MEIPPETKILLGVVLLSLSVSFAHAQDPGTVAAAGAACGAGNVEFDVKTDKSQHPTLEPETGKAVVYVIAGIPREAIIHLTVRVGLDGVWVGANQESSYFAFPVDPGVHHICARVQSSASVSAQLISLHRLTAEAGRVYYFRIATDNKGYSLVLQPVDEDEGQYLVRTSAHSSSHPKPK
jgi:hypothetical protein